MHNNCRSLTIVLFVLLSPVYSVAADQAEKRVSLEDFIRANVASKKEIDVFLHEMSWAQFDPDVGYILGNYMPRDGVDGSSTFSTVQPDGARTSFMYKGKPCRINTYGNSFTQCHQVSDGETWQEYLAAHLGEPVRNFGMGGFGFYQAYRRMLREEQTDNSAEYVMLYIWGDDHVRSLLRCRYMLTASWNRGQNEKEGRGRMFHGNFWSNIEMNLTTGELEEHDSRIPDPENLYQMTDPDWMVENLRDDMALAMSLYSRGYVHEIDVARLKQLGGHLNCSLDLDENPLPRSTVASLLDAYSFAATKTILRKARAFTNEQGKKLMVILLDPYRVTRPLLQGGTRYDQEIVDFLQEYEFTVFDMNLVHCEDYKSFSIGVGDYLKRYYIGHYSPAGNHFFAYSLKDHVVDWLDPKPLPYRDTTQKIIDFKGYLQE
ncbi:MAG: hypothetical protein H8E44_09620 [Planctomycetes bacterium]|nr:hypothetical protein [Planctomycetota bacterium]MBL7039081.1 hypothetical protein [Pirellulaceae bacterium]